MNLTRFETKDGIELIIDTQTGESFATQRGYARMSGRDASTISRRCAKLDESGIIKTAEIDTGYGIKAVALIPADLVYDWMFEDNPALAKTMGKAGATVFMHQLAGFKISSTASITQKSLQLPPADVRVANLISALDRIGFDMQNPRFDFENQNVVKVIEELRRILINNLNESLRSNEQRRRFGVHAQRIFDLYHVISEAQIFIP